VFHNEKCLMNASLFLPQLKTKLNGVLMLPFKVQNHCAPVFEKMANYQQGSKGMLFIMDTWYQSSDLPCVKLNVITFRSTIVHTSNMSSSEMIFEKLFNFHLNRRGMEQDHLI
jgi:hypothetical protein